MNHESIIENIKSGLHDVDAATLQSIWRIIDQSRQPSTSSKWSSSAEIADRPLQFVGENLTLEEYDSLSLQERGLLQLRLKEQNHRWLQEKFSRLDAAWIVVIDGQVIASGKSLRSKPMQPEILSICQQAGKFPFVFVNDKLITIEEDISVWHKTSEPDDYYPTIPLTLSSTTGAIGIAADLDTGASHTFVDYGLLAAKNVIRPYSGEYVHVLELAGYPVPDRSETATSYSRLAARTGPTTKEEEDALLEYLEFLRSRRKRGQRR